MVSRGAKTSQETFFAAMKNNAKLYLQGFLDGIRDRVPTVTAVLVSDSDGVVLLKSVAQAYQENSVDATLAAVYAASTAQASKLQFGKNRAVVSWQKDRVLMHVNAFPFFVSVICSKDTGDVGALLSLVPNIVKVRIFVGLFLCLCLF